MAETQKAVMKYQARDGQTITLTFDTIKRYLVQGHPEYVTDQEFMYFMGVCKSRGMNPFKMDCYLIKYSQKDKAAIITSIDFLRSRAKSMPDCKGWQAGIIVQRQGQLVYSNGLMLEGDILLGAWGRGKPEGWETEYVKEINLNGYIKHTTEGKITKFWKEEKQPTQIAKVAESQLLRTLWPDEFQNLYTDAEISPDDSTKLLSKEEIIPDGDKKEVSPEFIKEAEAFDRTVDQFTAINQDHLKAFLTKAVETFKIPIEEVKAEAMKDFNNFLAKFQAWENSNQKKSNLSPEEEEVRKGFINIKKPGTLRSTDILLKKEMQTWSDELKKEWQDKWLRIMREPYEFKAESPEIPPEDTGKAEKTSQEGTGSTPVEYNEAKVRRLIPAAQSDEVGRIFVQCPFFERNLFITQCDDPEKCPPGRREKCELWSAYDKEANEGQ